MPCPCCPEVCPLGSTSPSSLLAVEDLAGCKENGSTFLISDDYYAKSIRPSGGHGRGGRPAPGAACPGKN